VCECVSHTLAQTHTHRHTRARTHTHPLPHSHTQKTCRRGKHCSRVWGATHHTVPHDSRHLLEKIKKGPNTNKIKVSEKRILLVGVVKLLVRQALMIHANSWRKRAKQAKEQSQQPLFLFVGVEKPLSILAGLTSAISYKKRPKRRKLGASGTHSSRGREANYDAETYNSRHLLLLDCFM